ncbi:MAG: hypothetical protein HOP31_03175 [Ignavibacteria bacterium]|nr:hypothetical protein [Ignavibacteria bacterium]
MKKIIILGAFIVMLVNCLDAIGQTDSLRLGRNCKIVLYNGFQSEGRIVNRTSDTITLQTDITNLFIPVKDIKFVMNPEVELSDLEETDTLSYSREVVDAVKLDTTDKCDVYLQDKSVMRDILLVIDTDSTLKIIKENRTKVIGIAGIRKIVFKTSAPFGKGYLFGSAIGFFIGFIPLAFIADGGHPDISGFGPGILFGLLCSIPAGLIGGVVGVITASDDVYVFDNGIYPAKIKRIHHAMSKHY